ncbi:DMT family transporter [Kitasatospora kifunensis]|uniref:Drug/metabolite transporter (DMT)-like permease n=1 Tax=Kitasatospora kifunensis TaxID=58351 RepID=A0A7W7R463_KITKI|nr:DMT family transporter [Kitasatospora kifunensis]MBB4925014.1 drug/metabolite transporter (DMT)-like permease [Kitasatospora kifunensis]
MSVSVVGLVLVAAVLHASWNALLRGGVDRLWLVTVMSLATSAIALPFALVLPLPGAGAWPYLLFSAAMQVLYTYFLVWVYRLADLGAVYPVIRGCVPLLVTLGAALLAGQRLTLPTVAGVGLVSLGIMATVLGRGGGDRKALGLAVLTGAVIATYTVTDGVGVRHAGSSTAYTAWIFLVFGALMLLTHGLVHGRVELRGRGSQLRTAGLAGLVQITVYAMMMWALSLSPMGPVSALRETSVVFATLIGWRFLGEKLSPARLGACSAIALGAFCLSYYA